MSYFPVSIEKTAFGEQSTAALQVYAAWRMDYSNNPALYNTVVANGGTATQSASRVLLRTGGGANGSARLSTRRMLRYLPGVGGLFRGTCVFAAGTVNTRQLIGIGDSVDGLFFGYNGTALGVLRRRNSVDTWVAQASWNGQALGMALNPQLGNIYQIRYQWLGYGPLLFYIFDTSSMSFVLVHTIVYPNTSVDTSLLSPTLPIMAECVALGGSTADLTFSSASTMGATEGGIVALSNPLDVNRAEDSLYQTAGTALQYLFSLRNKLLAYTGLVTNRVAIRIVSLTFGRANTVVNTETFRIYTTVTTAIPLVYTDVDTTNSPVEVSTTVTTVTSGVSVMAYQLGASDTSITVYFENEIFVYPGETLTFSVQASAANATDTTCVVNYVERF